MSELILFSIIVGIFVKGWIGKLLIFPSVLALYATIRFYFSSKAKIIRQNKIHEGGGAGNGNYLYIFMQKALICAAISGLSGLVVKLIR
ncbi:MAG: hypothetical protein H8D23_27180 [Candidatus Brocadiales bacterium]|nr:hypothetical protein [Candidatus Brocadiales bacterium]